MLIPVCLHDERGLRRFVYCIYFIGCGGEHSRGQSVVTLNHYVVIWMNSWEQNRVVILRSIVHAAKSTLAGNLTLLRTTLALVAVKIPLSKVLQLCGVGVLNVTNHFFLRGSWSKMAVGSYGWVVQILSGEVLNQYLRCKQMCILRGTCNSACRQVQPPRPSIGLAAEDSTKTR